MYLQIDCMRSHLATTSLARAPMHAACSGYCMAHLVRVRVKRRVRLRVRPRLSPNACGVQ